MEGRADLDVMKIHGATIHAELVSQALRNVQDVIEPRWQLHVHEKLHKGKPTMQLSLHVKLRQDHTREDKNTLFVEILKEKISADLQLSGKMMLKDFIEQGIFLPLEIVFVGSWNPQDIKSRNIISHLE